MFDRLLIAAIALVASNLAAHADPSPNIPGLEPELISAALTARAELAPSAATDRLITIIDYRKPSGEARFHLVDLVEESVETLLVAHGRGSDPDHDGYADTFSNTPNSKMSSLGGFVTGDTYYGRHGLSLRLHGLEPRNDLAEARAIVIHGADYVSEGRNIMGRSWGCPALSQSDAQRVIPIIAGGSFIYIVGG